MCAQGVIPDRFEIGSSAMSDLSAITPLTPLHPPTEYGSEQMLVVDRLEWSSEHDMHLAYFSFTMIV